MKDNLKWTCLSKWHAKPLQWSVCFPKGKPSPVKQCWLIQIGCFLQEHRKWKMCLLLNKHNWLWKGINVTFFGPAFSCNNPSLQCFEQNYFHDSCQDILESYCYISPHASQLAFSQVIICYWFLWIFPLRCRARSPLMQEIRVGKVRQKTIQKSLNDSFLCLFQYKTTKAFYSPAFYKTCCWYMWDLKKKARHDPTPKLKTTTG